MMHEDILEEIRRDLAEIKQAAVLCGPCRDMVHRHDEAIYGNGTEGLAARMKAVEATSATRNRGDVVSLKSLKMILVAVSALCTTLATAIVLAVQAVTK